MTGSSWLIRDGMDRERVLDMEERLRATRVRFSSVIVLALLALGPWYGWWLPVPVLVSFAVFAVVDRRLRSMRRPEVALFGAWVGVVLVIGSFLVLAHAPAPLMAWLIYPIMPLVSRFSVRAVVLGVLVTLLTLGLTLALARGSAAFSNPPLLIAPAGLIVVVAVYALPLIQSHTELSSHALLDSLTGMLNRVALKRHVEELEQRSLVRDLQVAVIVVDIDHFKRINDTYGHSAGDDALRDTAQLISAQLRSFDNAFRVGGEEFVILLPVSDRERASAVAERVRAAIEDRPLGDGIPITVSCGVATSDAGARFDYQALFARADAALYEAKGAGRNCVRDCEHTPPSARRSRVAAAFEA